MSVLFVTSVTYNFEMPRRQVKKNQEALIKREMQVQCARLSQILDVHMLRVGSSSVIYAGGFCREWMMCGSGES